MPIDSMAVSRHYRNVRDQSVKTQVWQPSIPHSIKPNEVLDPSLTCQYVYNTRHDWYAVAAITGINCVDQPVAEGRRLFLTAAGLYSHSPKKKSVGLY